MKKSKILSLILCCSAILSGCGAEQESTKIPILTNMAEGISYTTAEAIYDDITVSGTISCTYREVASYNLSFGLDGYRIDYIDVKKGDIVQKGQLLASLNIADVEKSIPELEHTLEADQLRLKQLVETRDFELESAQTLFYYTKMTSDDEKALKEQKESITNSYKDRIQNLEDTVALDTARLAQAKEQLEKGRIYAPVTGEVTFVQNMYDVNYSDTRETTIIVSDLSTCYFESTDNRYIDYLQADTVYQVQYVKRGESEFYDVIPVNMDTWDETGCLQFALVSDTVFPALATVGKMTISLGERLNVLSIPVKALHSTEDGYFVYILEDGIRRIREVTIGLSGSDKVEILSGLKEHEQVILSQKAGEEVENK